MEHNRDRIKELATLMLLKRGVPWPSDLLYAVDALTDQPFLALIGVDDPPGEEETTWTVLGCTERSVLTMSGKVNGEGVLQSQIAASLHRVSDLRSISVVGIQQIDEAWDPATRATWRLEFASGQSFEISTIGVKDGRVCASVENSIAQVRDLAGI